MEKNTSVLIAIVIVGMLVLTACGGGGQANRAPASSGKTLDRPAPPAEYADKKNPKAGDEAAVTSGQQIYQTNCAACHGEKGKGDGPGAAALNPKPQDLVENQSGLSDAYLYWRIAEGGGMDPFKSAMPGWKSLLDEEQLWSVISYIRKMGG